MPNNNIHYLVIALNKNEAEDVIKKLRENNLDKVADCLNKYKENYGNVADEWKPFGGKTIKNIMNGSSTFISNTPIISSRLKEGISKSEYKLITKDIEIFFIDIFSMYLEKYNQFANYIDTAFTNVERVRFCLLTDYSFPKEVRDHLNSMYDKYWESVLDKYNNGSDDRIAGSDADLYNFKNNYIKSHSKEIEESGNKITMAMVKLILEKSVSRPEIPIEIPSLG